MRDCTGEATAMNFLFICLFGIILVGFLNGSTSRKIKGVRKPAKNVPPEQRGYSRDVRKLKELNSADSDAFVEISDHELKLPILPPDDSENADVQSNSLVFNRVPDDYLREDAKLTLAVSTQHQVSPLPDSDHRDPFAVQLADGFVMITIDGNITRVGSNGDKVWSVSTGGPMMTSYQVCSKHINVANT